MASRSRACCSASSVSTRRTHSRRSDVVRGISSVEAARRSIGGTSAISTSARLTNQGICRFKRTAEVEDQRQLGGKPINNGAGRCGWELWAHAISWPTVFGEWGRNYSFVAAVFTEASPRPPRRRRGDGGNHGRE